jgi:ribosomal protein S18 acetylase RimI-like enzyme
MPGGIQLAPLQAPHRLALEALLRRIGRFREREIAGALELFDLGIAAEATRASSIGMETRPPRYELVGAFDADTMVGFVCFGATPATDRTYDMHWIAVSGDAQRAGVGTWLLQHVEETLRGRGARMLVMETSSRDEYQGTRAFYLAREYVELARVKDFYAPGDDRVVYGRLLG